MQTKKVMFYEGKLTKGIEHKSSWASALKMLVTLLEDGGKDGKAMAKKELGKMAEAADKWNNIIDSSKEQRDEIEAMGVIINIQMMQEKVYGKRFEHEDFAGNTIDELRALQEIMVGEWNEFLKTSK